jgi:hypothetical protein
LSLHAYSLGTLLGFAGVASSEGVRGIVDALLLPDMSRYIALAGLMAMGDMLSIASMAYLDPGSFMLLGKGISILMTVALSYVVLGKRQSHRQYIIVALLLASTTWFLRAQSGAMGLAGRWKGGAERWLFGMVTRALGVVLGALASVVQECLMTGKAVVSFWKMQTWICMGGALVSLGIMHIQQGISYKSVFQGFDDWPLHAAIVFNVLAGLVQGLLLKRCGAMTKALCLPMVLGGSYFLSVVLGSAAPNMQAFLAWLSCSALIAAFALAPKAPKERCSPTVNIHNPRDEHFVIEVTSNCIQM